MPHWLSTSDSIVLLGSVASGVTALVAIVAAVYAKGQIKEAQKQLQQSHRVAHGDFLLRLDEAFQRHTEVHKLLQPAFAWGQPGGGPSEDEDWFKLTQYMGLFERVNFLLKSEIMDLTTIDALYGYRLYNIVSNDTIRKVKLEKAKTAVYWENLIDLWLTLKVGHQGEWEQYPNVILVRKKQD